MKLNQLAHQCPLCCAKHYNGSRRLCDACYRKAFALDLLQAFVILVGGAFFAGAVALALS